MRTDVLSQSGCNGLRKSMVLEGKHGKTGSMGPMTKRHTVCLTPSGNAQNNLLCQLSRSLGQQGEKNMRKQHQITLKFQTLGFYWKCNKCIYSKWWHTGHIGANHRLEVRGELASANVAYCHRIATCGVSNPQIPQMHDEALIINPFSQANLGL